MSVDVSLEAGVSHEDVIRRINYLLRAQTPDIDAALDNLAETSRNLNEGTGDLKRQPSLLLFSQPPARSETVK